MVIYYYYGTVCQKSNIGFWVNFQFQNHHPRYKITASSLLNQVKRKHIFFPLRLIDFNPLCFCL